MNEEELKRQEEEAERLQREEELRRTNEAITTADEMNRDAEERRNGAIASVAPGIAAMNVASDEEVSKRLRTPGRDTSVPVLDENNNRVFQTKAAPAVAPATQTAAAPAKPAQPEDSRLKDVKIINGKSVTEYGSKVRMVDQKTKQETWYEKDAQGNLTPISEPQSETQRRMMAKGHTFASLQQAGFKGDAWGAAIAAQRQNESDARLAKSRAYSDEIMMAQANERDAIRKRRANTVLALGDATKTALAELSGDIMLDPETKTIFGKDGKPVDPRVRVAEDGSYYLWGALRKDALTALNKRRTGNGGSELTHVAAYTPIDKYGNRKKNADGTEVDPMVAVTDQDVGGKTPAKFNHYQLSHIARQLVNAHRNAGNGEGEAVQQEVMSMLGGRDPLGWRKAARHDGKLTYEQQKDLANQQIASTESQTDKKLAAQKEIAMLEDVRKKYGIDTSAAIEKLKIESEEKQTDKKLAAAEATPPRFDKSQYDALEAEVSKIDGELSNEKNDLTPEQRESLTKKRDELNGKKEAMLRGSSPVKLSPAEKPEEGESVLGVRLPQKSASTQQSNKPKGGAGQESQTAVVKNETAPKPVQNSASAPATQGAGEPKKTGKYDTELNEKEEAEYQKWRSTLPKPLQYEGDYDLRGYWKDPNTKKEAVDGDHFIDKYKKPNHPTFSNESQYAVGEDAKKAGRWDGEKFIKPESQKPNADQQTKQLTDDELLEKYKNDPRGRAFKGESRENHVSRLRRIDEGKTLADQIGKLFDKAKPEVKRTVSYMLKKLVKFANEPLISPETAENIGSAIDPLHKRR